jgi:Protein of unknown function (DUF3047)
MMCWLRSCAAVGLAALLAACWAAPPERRAAGTAGERVLFAAETAIQDEWQPVALRGETEYRLAALDGRLAIRAVGRRSASGLLRPVQVDSLRCPVLEWTWRVERLQPDADLRVKEGDDVAASLFLFFGDPGLLINPNRVPTLRYVWTSARIPVGAIVDSPYAPGTVRSLVVESGESRLGRWVTERRRVADDFEQAFGRRPPAPVQAIALFTDNDQTGQPVEAYYAGARALCE